MNALGRRLLALLVIAAALLARPASADTTVPKELQGIEIEEHTGSLVPLDIRLRDQDGRDVTLGDYLADGKPLVVQLAYFECPMLCSLVINGLVQGMKGIPQVAGEDFRVLVVSFDPRDELAVAKQKRDAYVASYGKTVKGNGFDFALGDPAEVTRLAKALGFRYRWDDKAKEYAHAAGLFVVSPGGQISRTLYGMTFAPKNLNLALREAALGHTGGTLADRIALFCFHYDPSAGKYTLAVVRIVQASGVLTLGFLSFLLISLWRREKRRNVEALEQRS